MVGDIRSESPDIALSSVKLMFLRILPFGANAYAKSLRKLMDSVSDQAFRSYSPYFAGMVKLTKRNSKRFRNSSRETDSILQEFPRLKQHRGVTLGFVKAHRQKHKLN